MIETTDMGKLPDSIPKEEIFAILQGDYASLNKTSYTVGLSEEAHRLLEEEAELYGVKDKTKALEILLRDRREQRRKRSRK